MNTKLIVASLATSASAFAGPEGIRAHWGMDDGTESLVSDISGNGNHAKGSGISWEQGVLNGCLRVEWNAAIQAPHSESLSVTDALTIEAWVKPWNPKFPDLPTILRKEGSYAFHLGPGKNFSLTLWVDGKQQRISSKHEYWSNEEWKHIAGTFDGQTMKLYVNGEFDSEKKLGAPGKISKSKSPAHVSSMQRRRVMNGRIDEVILRDYAAPEDHFYEAYQKGRFHLDSAASRFSWFFHKGKQKREAREVVDGFIWVDTEDFTDYGGWIMDTQFVPQMGSPFLMSTGIGTPVDDATTTIDLENAGTYRVWVRNRNWVPEHSPGKFTIAINDTKSEKEFGTDKSSKWVWQDAGIFELQSGKSVIKLKDLTGYYGRCDALIFTRDLSYNPPAELEKYKAERDRLTGNDTAIADKGEFDVVVVGGGVAGINAAISAARNGAKTALIQDRPMLGGNNSAEMGVPLLGPADYGLKNARESGLNEEIGRHRAYNFYSKWSSAGQNLAEKEENLTLFLNRHVYDTEMKGKAIKAVLAFDMLTGKKTRYKGDTFIDCTGDGWLGYYAGAEYMIGREAKDKFGEKNAPDKADNITMSGSLFQGAVLAYKNEDSGELYEMPKEPWFWDLTFNTEGLQARKGYENTWKGGEWWHENRNDVDDLWDPEFARDGLLRVSFSYLYWLKNHSSHKEKVKNFKTTQVPITNAKRETRRLVGDHILIEQEVLGAKLFDDRVAVGGWGLDIHHPDAIFSTEGPFDYNVHAPMYSIPFRSLYSKNINNLMFAGRDISVSRVALGSVRVQGTTGVMGQAVGTAAALCKKYDTTPRGVYQSHIKELQQELLKDDQYILDLKNEDPNDLARSAKTTASSSIENPENVINGVSRVVGEEKNMWISDPKESLPQWVELDFGDKKSLNTLYVTFDTNVNQAKHATWEYKVTDRMVPESARDYQIQYEKDGEWVTIEKVENNFQRRRIHTFDSIDASKVRVLITQTNGDASARIYEIRAYNEK